MKIIKLKRGDKIVRTIESKLEGFGITSGFLWGLGAVSEAELMLYKLENKKYFSKKFKGSFEVVSLTATITRGIDKKVMIHPHIVIADENFRCSGGHLKEGMVAATLEVSILKSKQELKRYFDKNIGLNLIK